MYSDTDIDRALLGVGSRFCRMTRILTSTTTVALAINDTRFELDAAPTIRPEHLQGLTLADACDPLDVVDYAQLNRMRQIDKTAKPCAAAIMGSVFPPVYTVNSAQPGGSDNFATVSDIAQIPANFGPGWRVTYAGQTRRVVTWNISTFSGTVDSNFSAPMEGGNPLSLFEWPIGNPPAAGWGGNFQVEIYPTNDAVRTLTARFWLPFTQWTPGTASAVQFNLPDDILAEILPFGPTALLQHNEPEHAYATPAGQKYLEIEASFMGAGILGKKVAIRRKRA
jgi:hypothetical protein